MKALDTNILVRLAARDDPEHLRLARQVIKAGDVLVLPTVLLEAAWVLQSRYLLSRRDVVDRLTAICGQPNVTVISAEAVAAALAAYAQAGDFADLLHFALASEAGAASFVTFDRGFSRPDGIGLDLQTL